MTTMFWGLRLEPGKRYSTTVDKSFHVSMAALDCSSVKGDDVLSVMLEEDEANVPYILCNLHKQKAMQARLDLNFMSGDRVTFFCKGQGIVHLSGYIVPDDDDEFGPLGDEEEEEEDIEEEEESTEKTEVVKNVKGTGKGKVNGIQVTGKRKQDDSQQPNKKKKVEQEEAESEESGDDEEDDDVEGLEDEEEDDDDDLEQEAMEEDSDASVEDEEESAEETETTVTPQSKKDKKNKQQQGQQQNRNLTPFAKQQQQSPSKTPKTANGLPAANQQQSGKKEKKKGGETPAGTPKANKSISEDSSPQKKTLEGGVNIKDIRVGNGQVCKPGRMVTVYYTGRLKSNNKVFDSTTQGPGFKFRVGRGEVIKGWDVGLAGMKVGGKRLITCPPQMAYGVKGSPPTIPGNSTLIFEVELKGVN